MKFSRQAIDFLYCLRCFRKKEHLDNITDALILNDTEAVIAIRGGGCSDSDEDDDSFDRLQEECKAEQHAKKLLIAKKQDEDADSDGDDKEDIAGISDLLDRKAARRPNTANSSGTAKSSGSLASRAAAAACLLSCSKSKKRDAQRPPTAEVKKESNAANVDTKKARQATGPRVSDDDDENETVEKILAQLFCIDGCVDSDDENESDENVPIIVNNDSDDDFDPTRATLPLPSPEQQKRLHSAYEKKLRKAGAYYFKHEGVSREPLIDDLLDTFDYRKLERGELMVLAQGKCPVPEGSRGGINFEGDTAPDDDNVFFNNASIRGAQCIANALPPTSDGSRQVFQYNKNNRLRMKGLNYRALCKSSKDAKGREHCNKHNAIEKQVAVMIAIATIEYLTAMGCFVMYLNLGGTAVKGLMEEVKRQLSDTQRRYVLVVESGTHMYRLSYCIGSPVEQADSVTRYMRNLSNFVRNFMVLVVNPVRENEGMNAIRVGDSLLQRLFDDENAVCVADLENQESSSYANLVEKTHEQAVARGRAGAQALIAKYGPDAYRILGRKGGEMSMAAGAARNGQTVSEYASDLGKKGGRMSMAAGAARNGQTVSEYASDLGRKGGEMSMAAGAARNGQTVSEYASDLGKKGGRMSRAVGAARNGQTVSEYASDLGSLGGSTSSLIQGLAAMNIDVDSCVMTLGKGGGFNNLEQLETEFRALGLDVEKVRSEWGTEMNKRRREKYTDAEISEQSSKSGKKGIAAVYAMVESSGQSVKAYLSEIATGNGAASSAGRLVSYKKKLVKDDGGALYHFQCTKCRSDHYVADKGNKWEDPDATRPNRESCRKCKAYGELPRPSSKSGKSGTWAFQNKVVGDARAQLHEEWGRDISEYEETQKKKRNAASKKSKKKKKKEKRQQNNK